MSTKRTRDDSPSRPVVGVVGLGYVGLPLLLAFRSTGLSVIGLDIDPDKIRQLGEGRSYLSHIPDQAVAPLLEGGCRLSVDPSTLADAEAIIIAVPTPLHEREEGQAPEPDLSYILDTGRAIGPHLRAGQLVSLESTTYPGTTRDALIPVLEETSGLTAGRDFDVAYSPERVDPGTRNEITNTPKLVAGLTPGALERALDLYGRITPAAVPVSSLEAAEMAKLLENIYRAVNIAMVNELKELAILMGLDIWEIVDAAATKPFGFQPFYPGPGLGGHCLPIDPFYLSWQAEHRYGFKTNFIRLAGSVNERMPAYVVSRTRAALAEEGGGLAGAQVLLIGVAYKKDVGDTRESPGLRLMRLFEDEEAIVTYHDPFVPEIPPTRDYPAFQGRNSVPLTEEALASAAAVVIVTDHTDIDYASIGEHAGLVVDTRRAMRDVGSTHARIIPA